MRLRAALSFTPLCKNSCRQKTAHTQECVCAAVCMTAAVYETALSVSLSLTSSRLLSHDDCVFLPFLLELQRPRRTQAKTDISSYFHTYTAALLKDWSEKRTHILSFLISFTSSKSVNHNTALNRQTSSLKMFHIWIKLEIDGQNWLSDVITAASAAPNILHKPRVSPSYQRVMSHFHDNEKCYVILPVYDIIILHNWFYILVSLPAQIKHTDPFLKRMPSPTHIQIHTSKIALCEKKTKKHVKSQKRHFEELKR